jgi:hypothetical protein
VIHSIYIVQNGISKIVLSAIMDFLEFGTVTQKSSAYQYGIHSLTNINKFIISFKDAEFLGAKALDYRDFCIGINIINNKEHKSKEGMEKVRLLINNLNAKRTRFE